jgi:1,4-alpha-glucan branching enzyme
MIEPQKPAKKIHFSLLAPEAQNVAIAGTFNNWNMSSHPMKRSRRKRTGDGEWQITVTLEPGAYQYLFVVDGQWRNDPSSFEQTPNDFGTYNDLVRV